MVPHRINGNSISVDIGALVGDIEPKTSLDVRYNVLVKKGAAFEAEDKTLTNVAEAVGSNGRGRADDNVILKPNERPEDPNEPGTIKAVKTANKDTVDLKTDPRVTYSVTMVNNDTKPWENVKIVDVLDARHLYLYKNCVSRDIMNDFSLLFIVMQIKIY